MSYDILIRKNESGEIRRYTVCVPDWNDEVDIYWLTEGTYGCDCNRKLAFERAGGNEPDLIPCGDGSYSILKAILPDGREIPLDAEDSQ